MANEEDREKNSDILKAFRSVQTNFHTAIALQEIINRASYDKEYIKRFDNTLAAHAFDLIRNQLLLAGILALNRIWDNAQDALSIPTVVRVLGDVEVQKVFVETRRNEVLERLGNPNWPVEEESPSLKTTLQNLVKDSADETVEATRTRIAQVLEAVETARKSNILVRLRVLRDRELAHSLTITHEEKKQIKNGEPIEAAQHGDFEDLLEETSPIVEKLHWIMEGVDIGVSVRSDNWKEYAQDFWDSIEPSSRTDSH